MRWPSSATILPPVAHRHAWRAALALWHHPALQLFVLLASYGLPSPSAASSMHAAAAIASHASARTFNLQPGTSTPKRQSVDLASLVEKMEVGGSGSCFGCQVAWSYSLSVQQFTLHRFSWLSGAVQIT